MKACSRFGLAHDWFFILLPWKFPSAYMETTPNSMEVNQIPWKLLPTSMEVNLIAWKFPWKLIPPTSTEASQLIRKLLST